MLLRLTGFTAASQLKAIIFLVSLALLSFSVAACAPQLPQQSPSGAATVPQDAQPVALQAVDLADAVPKRVHSDARLGFPLADFVGANFVGSLRCGGCHKMLRDNAGNDMSILNHWRSTMMANAAKDPLWQAKVRSETSRNPALRDIIEKKCVTCHMPMAWAQKTALEGEYAKNTAENIFDDFLHPASPLHEAAMDGVSCSLCHQIQDLHLGKPESFSGKFTIDTRTPAPDRKIFGPYREPVTYPMQDSVQYTPAYGQHTNDSALCATCHTLYTPYVDAAGQVKGEFPEQTVYLEWLHSAYGEKGGRHDIDETLEQVRTCQECHMPHSTAGGVFIANWAPPEAEEKDHFSRHHFVGGNVFMLNVLQDNLVQQKVSASTAKLEDTRTRTVRQLQTGTARLSFLNSRVRGNTLTTTLKVENLVGHKYPSGFPSRRTWIHLTVTDHAGAVLFESGKPMADGSIAGDNADLAVYDHEPHYEKITAADQVQIYEAMMHDTDGKVTYTLLRGAGYIKDNRLLPAGFDKESAPADIAVHGGAAADDNFTGGSDTITYAVTVGEHSGPLTIRAALLYTPISYAFMQDLENDAGLPLVARFARYFAKADKTPVTVAAAQTVAR